VGAVLLLAVTAVRELSPTLENMRSERGQFVGLTPAERERAFGERIPLRMDVFDFYRSFVRPGDHYWVQVAATPFSAFANKATVVRTVGRLALLPAVEVSRPADADVILSWDSDPAVLPYRYSEQHRAGEQLLFVSRVQR
jgi:hypothetical protein